MNREELERFLDQVLESGKFGDYSPNGLQVEGQPQVARVLTGVTASQALLDEAVRRGADTVIVHHGYFWKGESPRVVGYRRQRLATLLKHDINLLAYHLPLDAHPELGNNAQWALAMGWQPEGRFGDQQIGWWGRLAGEGCSLDVLARDLALKLGRPPLVVGEGSRLIRRIAWCSGGAQGYLEAAAALGVDAYLSGEISEQTTHLARETGVAYLACGHHATERFGPQALAAHLRQALGLDCEFVDIANPA
ncbi:Nif3-like dinuclear metal center hexameric protein [Azovibrio restrictus]|uniref:Nif3-like dinuclear metal center hexameric protein n=1 Tax=Azovibrio restrictus TaxID=146938 RepID=UPI0026F0ED14|nr:Nif3-like dinuclear metal center hexameric protein [Azovibrio restrictus]MDD3481514.1 Nif3-like dinuclear metal center hexameric protein [Azovibrio restrictus]